VQDADFTAVTEFSPLSFEIGTASPKTTHGSVAEWNYRRTEWSLLWRLGCLNYCY
jgi:hypothetical protein